MATEWYYSKGGQQHGPVSPQELKKFAQDGTLQPRDLVWKDGMTDWVPVTQIKGLLSAPTGLQTGIPQIVQTPSRARGRGRSQAGQVVLIIAALTMIGAMFSPWWSFKLKETGDDDEIDRAKGRWEKVAAGGMLYSPKRAQSMLDTIDRAPESSDSKNKKDRREAIAFLKIVKKDHKWWDKHLKKNDEDFDDRLKDEAEDVDDDDKLSLSMTIWGWSEGIAVMGVSFGGSMLLLIILFLCIPPIRGWNWIVSVIATAMGVVALVFSILWILDAPGNDAGASFSQGMIVGPFLLLGASGIAVITGILDTIFGIGALVRNRRLR